MCDIVSHALRMESSAGSFAVFYQQEHAPHDISANVPVTIETLSFILAAVCIILFLLLIATYNEHYLARTRTQTIC